MRLLISVLVAALAGALIVLVPSDTPRAEAASFNPHGSTCLDDAATDDIDPFDPGDPGECDGDSTPGTSTSITTTFEIDAPDSNFSTLVFFTPPQWTVASDADVPDGARVARVDSLATVGLLNGPCNTLLQASFDMLDATTNQAQTVIFNNEPGDGDFTNRYDSDGVAGEQFEEVNGLARGVTNYPDYLTRVLVDHVSGGRALTLRARRYGQTVVSGVDVSLNLAIFEPGVTLRDTYSDPALGYPSVTVLQSGGDPNMVPAPGAITGFCSPLKTSTTTYGLSQDNPKTPGSEAGAPYRKNPAEDGSYNFVTYASSYRDADGDGHENILDTCPFVANPGWDPRAFGIGDADNDGIPDNCDPLPNNRGNPGQGGINDHDGDSYQNRQDNCPLDHNGLFDLTPTPDTQRDSDGDGIGDACDGVGEGGIGKGPDVPDGDAKSVCIVNPVDVGTGGPPAGDPRLLWPCTVVPTAPGADLKVVTASIICPGAAEAGAPFSCAVAAMLHDNGPISQVAVGGAINVGFPAGCSAQDYTPFGKGFGTLALPVSSSVIVTKDFNLVCSGSGPYQLVGCAILQLRETGITDPDPNNNHGVAYATVGEGDGPAATASRCSTVDPPEVCGDGIDNDNDGLVDEEPDTDGDGVSDCVDTDDDGDGFSDEAEAALGTDPLAACPIAVGAHPSWPPDFDDDRAVDLADVLALKPVYGAASRRYDLDRSGGIDISDVLALKPFFGASCG